MRDLDETDLRILQLLIEDARRPYSDIAEVVGLTPPAVSDRVSRLEETGVIRQFTVDVDRTKLEGGIPVVLELAPGASAEDDVVEALAVRSSVEHVFELADGRLLVQAAPPTADVRAWLFDGIDPDAVTVESVELLARHEWSAVADPTDFALSCVVCGNAVDGGGETARFDGEVKAFCCPSCLARYEEEYERHSQNAD